MKQSEAGLLKKCKLLHLKKDETKAFISALKSIISIVHILYIFF